MSQPKMAQTFPARKEANLDKILMREIPKILRAAESQPSMRKRLTRMTVSTANLSALCRFLRNHRTNSPVTGAFRASSILPSVERGLK